ncbi:MAG: HEPN domain-containing protein [Anaerolineales bacterium]|nr:HEPN domain-containing protein [Anaerolineales bacterium]
MNAEPSQVIHKLVCDWLRLAKADLAIAQMVNDERIAVEILVFHAQQAVEKALKALLVQHQVEFPKTHSIGMLLNLCKGAGYDVPDDLGETATMAVYAVAARYPGTELDIDANDTREAAEQAWRLLAWVETQIIKPPC